MSSKKKETKDEAVAAGEEVISGKNLDAAEETAAEETATEIFNEATELEEGSAGLVEDGEEEEVADEEEEEEVEISDEELADLIESTEDEVMCDALIALQQKVRKANEKQEELLLMLQRSVAEFANFRKRTENDKAQWRSSAEEGVLLNLLEIMDSYESALNAENSAEETTEKKHTKKETSKETSKEALKEVPEKKMDSFLEGFHFIYKQLCNLLSRYEVVESTNVGDVFNPEIHRAIRFEEGDGEEDTVKEVYQKGYMGKSKVVREATVLVAKKKV